MFSHLSEGRPERYLQFDDMFNKYFDNPVVLHADNGSFYEQISEVDIIYLHGGRTQLLLEAIPDIDRFVKAVEGKVVIGSSAGANFLSRVCYSPSASQVMSASAILNIGVVVHYGIDQFEDKVYSKEFWDSAVESLKSELDTNVPILLLPEGKFSIFEI